MHSQLSMTNEPEDGLEHNNQSEQHNYKSLSDLIQAFGACQGQSGLCDPNAFLDYTLVPYFEDLLSVLTVLWSECRVPESLSSPQEIAYIFSVPGAEQMEKYN